MAITRFSIPASVLVSVAGIYDDEKIVNAVQSEINNAEVKNTSSKSRAEWKSVKVDGTPTLMIDVSTKSGEKIRLQNNLPSRFYGWCLAVEQQQSFAATEVSLPEMFKSWFERKFKLVQQPASNP